MSKKHKRKMARMDGKELHPAGPPQDTSPKVAQRGKLKTGLTIYQRELNERQKQFVDTIMDKSVKLVFCNGPAGTAKTYIAIYCALQLLNQKKVSDLIYVRSAVESSDHKLGYLPGELTDKMAPYLQPLVDKLEELLPAGEIEMLKKDNRISSVPISYMRGLNWNAKVIVVDEAQNITYDELVTIITRVGEFSKIFIIGDTDQSDVKNKSGFQKISTIFSDKDSQAAGIATVQFTEDDCVRSELCKFILKKLKAARKYA